MLSPKFQRDQTEFGVLECMSCTHRVPNLSAGLTYGFPRHCGQTMRRLTPADLARERAYLEELEEELHLEAAEK